MSPEQLLLFISVTFFVSASPGPVMLSCMAYAGRYGFQRSLYAMLGASIGNVVLVILSALGLGLLLNEAEDIFYAVQWIGAAYLVYLGIQQYIASPELASSVRSSASTKMLLMSAFLIAVTNPKGFIYFGALFPQFIDVQKAMLPQFAFLTVIFLIMDLTWMIIYAKGGTYIMSWLKKPSHQRLFNRISGIALIMAGVLMAFAKI